MAPDTTLALRLLKLPLLVVEGVIVTVSVAPSPVSVMVTPANGVMVALSATTWPASVPLIEGCGAAIPEAKVTEVTPPIVPARLKMSPA